MSVAFKPVLMGYCARRAWLVSLLRYPFLLLIFIWGGLPSKYYPGVTGFKYGVEYNDNYEIIVTRVRNVEVERLDKTYRPQWCARWAWYPGEGYASVVICGHNENGTKRLRVLESIPRSNRKYAEDYVRMLMEGTTGEEGVDVTRDWKKLEDIFGYGLTSYAGRFLLWTNYIIASWWFAAGILILVTLPVDIAILIISLVKRRSRERS